MKKNNKKTSKKTIKSQLYFSAFLVVMALLIVSSTAFFNANKMAQAGQKIYSISLKGIEISGEIKSLYRLAQGSIARAPAELDQTKIEALKMTTDKSIDDAISLITQYKTMTDASGLENIASIENILLQIKENGYKVFEFAELFAADQANEILNTTFKNLEEEMETQMLVFSLNEQNNAEAAYKDLMTAQKSMYKLITVFMLCSILVAGGNSFKTAQNITYRTSNLTESMNTLADGDTKKEIPFVNDADEIGQMARAVMVFKENKINADALTQEQKNQTEIQIQRAEKINQYTINFDKEVTLTIKDLQNSSKEMGITAENMKDIAEQTLHETTSIAATTQQSASNMNLVSDACAQLTSAINEISDQVKKSTDISKNTTAEVIDASEKIKNLAEAANKIGEVITVIQDIAEQTNLLALNATIEAARAGEAGKGFAIVATEVKALANETAKATESIRAQVSNVQVETQTAVESIANITNKIKDLEKISMTISLAIEEQSASTQKISLNVQQAANAADNINNSLENVSEAARSVGDVSTQVIESSSEMTMQNTFLMENIEKFLKNIKNV